MNIELLDENSDKFFYKKLIKIAAPIALAQLMASLLSIIDMFMVSNLGELAVDAVGVGAQFAFLLFMMIFGFFTGLAIFIAQYWGSKEIDNIHKVFIISIIIGAIISLLFFIVAFFFPNALVGIFDHYDTEVKSTLFREFGVSYLRIAGFAYFSMTITFAIGILMRSVEKVGYPQYVAMGTVALNTLLNYLLINGNWGFPELGVRGAAIATTTSSFLGTIFLIGYLFFSKEEVFRIRINEYKNITKEFVIKLFKKALPVVLNETAWGLGMSLYLVAFAFKGENLSSIIISNNVMGIIWALMSGLSSACAIMIGKKLGENNLDLAKKWGIKFTKLSVVAGLVLGALLFVLSDPLANQFTHLSAEVIRSMSLILKVFSFYIVIKFVNVIQIVGTLRAGGDTLYSFLAEVGPLWLVGVPLAFILSIYTDLPLYLIIAIVNLEEVIKVVLLLWRFFTFKWVKNLTLE
ncbi:MAG: MATE family efflux transporter [Candidatus Izimaplasma sp.]|nr:MATE family efflux transporter [Candidatus Izimaplasma bacterium]